MKLSRQATRAGLGWKGIALTGVLSVAAHGAVLAAFLPEDAPVEIAGGASAAPAALGSDFRDFTQASIPTSATEAPAVEAQPAPPPTPTPAPAFIAATPSTPSRAIPAPETPQTRAGLVAAGAAPNTPLAALDAPSLVPHAAPTALPEAASPTTPEVLPPTPEPEVAVQTADATTPRAPQRPDFEARAREQQEREQQRERERQQAAAAQAAGDSDRNARRGSAEGTNGQAAQSAERPAQQASAAGNAAVTNYPGEVMRRIQRVRQARVRARGTAVVAFTIADGGALASASLSRASGNTELDQAALDHIRRAAPFPAPPPGAQRRFSFEFVGR